MNKVKQVLKDHFHAPAAQVVELEVGQKYMITQMYGSMVNIILISNRLNPPHRWNINRGLCLLHQVQLE